MASGGSGSCPQAALSPMTVVLGLCGRWAGTTTSLGTGTLPSAQFPQEAGPFCCSPFSGQGQPQIDTVGAVAAGAQANLPTSGCGVHGVGGGGRYEGAFFFLPRCPGSRAGKWRGKKGMPVACPSWRPWTPSCPPHAPQTSPCVCHCRMCTRLAVSEGHMATARCSAPAHLASSALRPPPENWPQTRSIQGPVVSAPPTMLHTFWGTIHPPVSIHPSIHPSIHLLIHLSQDCRGLPPDKCQPYASTSGTGKVIYHPPPGSLHLAGDTIHSRNEKSWSHNDANT